MTADAVRRGGSGGVLAVRVFQCKRRQVSSIHTRGAVIEHARNMVDPIGGLNCQKFTKEIPSGSYLTFRNARDVASVITLAQRGTEACELISVDKALPKSDLLGAGYF